MLDARGHEGQIVMISRRGLRSLGHAPQPFVSEGDFVSDPARTASGLLRKVRQAVRSAEAAGRTWHPVLDAVRAQGAGIWRALTQDARRNVVRRLRPVWDIHRFRIAPQIQAILERKLADSSLAFRKARLGTARGGAESLTIELHDSRQSGGSAEAFGAVIVATGPAHRDILGRQSGLAAKPNRPCSWPAHSPAEPSGN
jgi:uncharacterized NAD(P)/FAD-binding protein YdhS